MQRSDLFNLQVVMHFNATDQTLCRRAGSQIRGESTLCFFDFTVRHFQVVRDSNLCELEDIVYILDIPFDVCLITVLGCWDLLFGQEPGQCAHHSRSGCSDDVVKSGSVFFLGFNLIETLNPSVNAVINGLMESFDGGSPCGALLSYNFNP